MPIESKKVLLIGAGGQMVGRTAQEMIRLRRKDLSFVLSDISSEALARVTKGLTGSNYEHKILDIYDKKALSAAVAGKDLVIHGAGPFHKTAKLVRAACIEHGVNYMDIDDDVESGLEAVEMDSDAKSAGMAILSGCGASPGFTNIMAADLYKRLDVVNDIEVAWCVGDGEKMELGRAVAEHILHIGAGDCDSWRNGARQVNQSFKDTAKMYMGPELGHSLVYECAHPETVMLAHSYPALDNAICWGAMYPMPVNGIIKGVSIAEREGGLTTDQACQFLQDIMAGKKGSSIGWKYARKGVMKQIFSGEISILHAFSFFLKELLGIAQKPKMGISARVRGYKDGKYIELSRATGSYADGGYMHTMESATGVATAAFALMALDGPKLTGTHFPETWVDPQKFYSLLDEVFFKDINQTLVEPVVIKELSKP